MNGGRSRMITTDSHSAVPTLGLAERRVGRIGRAHLTVWASTLLGLIAGCSQTGSRTDAEWPTLHVTEIRVAVAPGLGFGEYGDDYVRFALIENNMRINQAIRGIKKVM